ncbi:hypothetical protein XF24_00204 [candidate division SR1 bacterium Aalborg_AAW-1]|nr:hypothetical protein XF24_00204 [candidate division SR1 bacterium Aalborg_AAW-1]
MLQIGDHYRHYKSTGGSDYTYEIIGMGKHTETGEMLVIYKSLYIIDGLQGADYWIRPSMRDEQVEYNGQRISRFTKIL